MTVGTSVLAFVLGAGVSLGTSWVLVSRLERVAERLGLSEALLGMVAALAGDAPEITASVTAVAHHQRAVGAGVTIGSNIFNLAALLGLGAVVAGRIALHRKVVVLGGAIALIISAVCLLAVAGAVAAGTGLALVLVVLVPYTVLLGARRSAIDRIGLPRQWVIWLGAAVVEEEDELDEAIRPRRGRPADALVALGALAVVVVASIAMERGASALGVRYRVAEIVVGGLVLAAVTSLPNAVAAVYLARKGRGAAALSTALNSNAINVTAGLLIPATVVGLSQPSASGPLVAGWYLGLTAVTLVLALPIVVSIGARAGRLLRSTCSSSQFSWLPPNDARRLMQLDLAGLPTPIQLGEVRSGFFCQGIGFCRPRQVDGQPNLLQVGGTVWTRSEVSLQAPAVPT